MRSNGLPPRFLPLLTIVIAIMVASVACSGGASAPSGNQPPAKTAVPTQPASGNPPAGSTAAGVDACALLTKAEIEVALGKPVLDGEPDKITVPLTSSCSFGDPEFPSTRLVGVTVYWGNAKLLYEMGKKNAADAKAVSGLGDDAFWDSILNNLGVLKGQYDIVISIGSGGKPDREAAAKALAPKLLNRLP